MLWGLGVGYNLWAGLRTLAEMKPKLKSSLPANVISLKRTSDLPHINWTSSITFSYNFKVNTVWGFIWSTVSCLYSWWDNEVQSGAGGKCMNRGHTGLMATVKAKMQLFFFRFSKHSALPPPGPPSSIYLPGISHVHDEIWSHFSKC